MKCEDCKYIKKYSDSSCYCRITDLPVLLKNDKKCIFINEETKELTYVGKRFIMEENL